MNWFSKFSRFKNLSGNRNLLEFIWVAGPKSLGGIVQLLMNFVLIRRLGPESFGIVSVCIAGIIASDAIFGPSVDLGVMRMATSCHKQNPQRSLKIQKSGLMLKLAVVLMIALLFSAASDELGQWLFQRQDAGPLLILSSLGVLGLGLLRSVQTHFQIEQRFTAFGISDLLQNLIKFGGMAIILTIRPSPEWVLALYVIGPLSVALGMGWAVAGSLLASPFDWTEARGLGREIRLYAATTAVGSTVARMDVFFVSALAGAGQAGIFSAANTFALIPQLLGMYMSVVLTPRIMPLWNEGRLATVYKKSQLSLGIVCIVILLVAEIGFPHVAQWLLPVSFSQAVGVFLLLLPAALCSLLNFPWTVSLLLFLRPRSLLAMDLAGLLILPLLYSFAVRSAGATGGALITSGFALVKTVAMQRLAWRVLKQGQVVREFA